MSPNWGRIVHAPFGGSRQACPGQKEESNLALVFLFRAPPPRKRKSWGLWLVFFLDVCSAQGWPPRLNEAQQKTLLGETN